MDISDSYRNFGRDIVDLAGMAGQRTANYKDGVAGYPIGPKTKDGFAG